MSNHLRWNGLQTEKHLDRRPDRRTESQLRKPSKAREAAFYIQSGLKVAQVQIAITLEPFKIRLNGFQQNVCRVSVNNDYVAIFM